MTVSRNRPRLLGVALAWLGSDVARADAGDAVTVAWHGATCAEADRLGARIDAALAGSRAPSTLEIHAEATDAGWRADLSLTGAAASSRSLHTADCAALVDAAELIAVVALDPVALADEVAAAVPPGNAVSVDVPPVERAPVGRASVELAPVDGATTPARTTSRSRPTSVPPRDDGGEGSVRLELGVGGIDLPGLGVRLGLGLGWQRRRIRVEMPVRWSWPRIQALDDAIAVRLQMVSALPRVCGVLGSRGLQVLGCGGVEVGAMIASGRGEGLATTRVRASPWIAPHLGVAMSWRLVPRVSGWLGVDGALALGRPRFHVREPADAYAAGPASISVILGLAVHFGSSFAAGRRTQPQRP